MNVVYVAQAWKWFGLKYFAFEIDINLDKCDKCESQIV